MDPERILDAIQLFNETRERESSTRRTIRGTNIRKITRSTYRMGFTEEISLKLNASNEIIPLGPLARKRELTTQLSQVRNDLAALRPDLDPEERTAISNKIQEIEDALNASIAAARVREDNKNNVLAVIAEFENGTLEEGEVRQVGSARFIATQNEAGEIVLNIEGPESARRRVRTIIDDENSTIAMDAQRWADGTGIRGIPLMRNRMTREALNVVREQIRTATADEATEGIDAIRSNTSYNIVPGTVVREEETNYEQVISGISFRRELDGAFRVYNTGRKYERRDKERLVRMLEHIREHNHELPAEERLTPNEIRLAIRLIEALNRDLEREYNEIDVPVETEIERETETPTESEGETETPTESEGETDRKSVV